MSTATHTGYGNGQVARAGEILRTVVGSGVHGIAIPGTDDHDDMGVFVCPRSASWASRRRCRAPLRVAHAAGGRALGAGRHRPGRVLVAQVPAPGHNPTALLPLSAQADAVLVLTPLGEELRAPAPAVLSQRAVRRFLGFMMKTGRGHR